MQVSLLKRGKRISKQSERKENLKATPSAGKCARLLRVVDWAKYNVLQVSHSIWFFLGFSLLELVTLVFCSFQRGERKLGPRLPRIAIDGITARPKSKRKAAQVCYYMRPNGDVIYCTSRIILS